MGLSHLAGLGNGHHRTMPPKIHTPQDLIRLDNKHIQDIIIGLQGKTISDGSNEHHRT